MGARHPPFDPDRDPALRTAERRFRAAVVRIHAEHLVECEARAMGAGRAHRERARRFLEAAMLGDPRSN